MLTKTTLTSLFFTAVVAMSAHAEDFKLSSTSIAEGAQLAPTFVFKGFGCDGDNQSPALSWSNAPAGTKSFAITAYDPDAPTGSGWWHWNVVNVPSSVTSLQLNASGEKKMPEGSVEIANDYGVVGFGGACPPAGEVHRYVFTVHALAVEKLDLPENPSNALAGFMINANAIGSAKITAVYNR